MVLAERVSPTGVLLSTWTCHARQDHEEVSFFDFIIVGSSLVRNVLTR